jgi:3-hydroxybutyryl-CoA dehydrogenase
MSRARAPPNSTVVSLLTVQDTEPGPNSPPSPEVLLVPTPSLYEDAHHGAWVEFTAVDGGRVAVFGTGVMASGIARLCLSRGRPVSVLSSSPDRAERLAHALRSERPDVAVASGPGELQRCSVFIEATLEDAEAKRTVLSQAEPLLPEDTVMATTTSSLSVTELAATLRRPGRFVGLHFFNPVHRIKLVEVVAGQRTGPDARRLGREFVLELGKRPLEVPDRAGFLVNRLLIPYLNQAARLVEEGFASTEDVDLAMKLGAGHPMGPFALIDLIGADVCVAIGRSLFDEFHRTSDAPSPELTRRVSLGLLGRKSGRGYYRYPKKKG